MDAPDRFLNQLNFMYSRRECELLWMMLLQKFGQEAMKEDWMKYTSELLTRKPVQYITGEAWFFDSLFKVSPDVLIPRPETEELTDWAISLLKNKPEPEVADICTGSGCIAVILAKKLSNPKILAIDVSSRALDIARENARTHKTSIDFQLNDILSLETLGAEEKFDLIISNPPYISEAEMNETVDTVKKFEPLLALMAKGDNPFIFYERIANLAKRSLKKEGLLLFEIHEDSGTRVPDMLEDLGFTKPEIRKDMQGKWRMVKAEKPSKGRMAGS